MNDLRHAGHLVQRNLVALELLRAAAWEQGLRVQLGVGVVDVDFAAQALAVRTQAEWDVVADHSQAILDAWDARVPKARAGVNEASAAELRDPAPATARPTNEAGACSELRDQSLRFDLLVGADGAFSEVRRRRRRYSRPAELVQQLVGNLPGFAGPAGRGQGRAHPTDR